MCYEDASLELVIAWLYGKQGVGIEVEEQRKTLAKLEGQRAFFAGDDPEGNAADTL
jgi:hypothetical protein